MGNLCCPEEDNKNNAYPECVACGRREHTRFKNMSAIERQFWTEDEEGRCMCWKCHGVYKQRLERDSALTRSSLGRSSVGSSSAAHEAAHVPSQEEMLLELKNHLSPPVHATPALHKIDSESAWDNTQSFSQPYRPSARVRQLEKMMGVDEGRGDVKQHETMPMDSLRMMGQNEHNDNDVRETSPLLDK